MTNITNSGFNAEICAASILIVNVRNRLEAPSALVTRSPAAGPNRSPSPASTPKAIVTRLNAEIDAILKQPDVVQKLNASGFELVGGTPDQFATLIKGESEKWAPIIKSANIKID